VQLIREGVYRCTICDAVVEVDGPETPAVMLVAAGGKATQRVVTVGGVEVHRCTFAPPGSRPRKSSTP
jgi:hypothetical protein